MKAPVSGGGNFEPAPAGTQVGIVVALYYLGAQDYKFQGEEKIRHEARVVLELPHAMREFKEGEGEKPYVIAKTSTWSMHEKSFLRKLVEACIGVTLTDGEAEAFDIEEILGKACLVNVQHYTDKEGTKRAGIDSVSPLMKGLQVPPATNELTFFSVNDFTMEQFAKLPEWIQKKIPEGAIKKAQGDTSTGTDEEINPDDIHF